MSELIEPGPIYRFGRFSLDPGERLLLCDAEPVDLTPRAFDLLVVLAENPGRLLAKRLLMERVWGGTFVEEANLSNNISLLRKVLAAPGGEARFIETVPRRGYRFVASVTKLTSAELAPMSVPETPANAPHPAVTSSRTIVTLLPGVAVGVVLAVGAFWFLFARFGPHTTVPFAGGATTRLTHTGRATHATISSDGRYVAYVERSPDGPSLWVRQLGAADSVQLVPPTRRQYVGLTFSPDGSCIYYVVREAPLVTEGALYKVRVQGGPSLPMLTRISSPISFAPGGAEFAYLRVPQEAPGSLMVATLDTAREDIAATRILAEGRFPFVSGVAWSPDGSVIATVQDAQSTGGGGVGLVAVRVDDGRLLAMNEGQWRRVTRLAWLADGGGLMINAEEQLDVGQLWHVPYPSGTSRRATVDASTDHAGLTLTADSRMLVAIHEDRTSTIWVQDHADTPARQITFGKYDGRFGVQWTPDDRIVYSSMESGNDDIWLMNADGSARRQLTTHPAVDDKPSVSADGRYVLFNSDRAGAFDLWRMDIDGSNQTRLTSGIRIRAHQPSDNARFAVASGNARLWKVPIDGGDPEPLSDAIAFSPAVSSDGRFVAACWRADRRSPPRLAVFSASGGQPLSVFNADCHPFDNGAIRWSVDDRDITYAWDGRLWAQAQDGGQPRLHPSVAYQDVLQFDWSASGRLVLARGDQSGDVVIIRR